MAGMKVADLYAALSLDNQQFEKGLKDSGTSFGGFGKLIAGGALVAVAAIAAIGAAAMSMTGDFDTAVDTIRVGTGATGDALKGLTDDFSATAKRVPDDMKAVGQVIADLNTRTGATGKTLEDLAVNLLDLSRITKTDVNSNVAASTRMFGDWGISTENQSEALDRVFRASQSTGIGVTDLMTKVVDFGSPMRLLGLSFEQSIALFGKWEKEGVNTGTAMSGLKMSVKTLAKEGVAAADMGTVFAQKLEGIKNSADPVGESIKLFGVRAGPDLAAAILEGRFATEDLVAVITGGADSIGEATAETRGLGEMWSMVTNALSTTVGEMLLPVLNSMEKWFTENLPAIQAVMEQVGAGMAAVVTALGELFNWLTINVLPILMDAFDFFTAEILPALAGAFQFFIDDVLPALGDVFTWLVKNILPPLQSIFKTWADNVLPALRNAFELVQKWISDNWPLISKIIGQVAGAVKTAVDVIAEVFKAVMPVIMKVVDVVFPLLGAAASAVGEIMTRVFDAIGVIWQTAADVADTVVKAIFGSWEGMGDFFSELFATVGGIIKGGLNFFIRIVNEMIKAINNIQVHIPKIGVGDVAVGPFDWNGVNLPRIPLLARGTSNFAGGWAVIGEDGPELAKLPAGSQVFPHSQSAGMMGGMGSPVVGTQNIYGIMPDEVERQTRRAIRREALGWALQGGRS